MTSLNTEESRTPTPPASAAIETDADDYDNADDGFTANDLPEPQPTVKTYNQKPTSRIWPVGFEMGTLMAMGQGIR